MPHSIIKPEICYRCKTFKKLCGLDHCPIVEKLKIVIKTRHNIKVNDYVQGSTPPSIVVGEFGYPNISIYYNIIPNVLNENAKFYEDPENWWFKLNLQDIVKLRCSLVTNTIRNIDVYDFEKLYEKEISIAGVSEKPVNSEIYVEKILNDKLVLDLRLLPLSFQILGELKITSNPKVHTKLDKLIWDDVKAEIAVRELYKSGIDVYTIQKAFSLGLLGIKRNRKLVPTRWSITAVDKILSNYLRNEIKKFNEIDKFEIYEIEYLSNRFIVFLIPDEVRIEWIEVWYPRNEVNKFVYLECGEDWKGNVETMDGGFEAARMGILEALYKRGVKARVFIVRQILPSYYIGVGNWHIRESMRRIFILRPIIKTEKFNEILDITNRLFPKQISEIVIRKLMNIVNQLKLL